MPFIPEALKGRPFTLAEARAAGVSDDALRGRAWRRLGPELYCLASLRFDTWQLLRALQPKVTAFAGRTAAWLHGIDVDPTPIEVIVPSNSGLRSRPGLEVHRTDELDFVSVAGCAPHQWRAPSAISSGVLWASSSSFWPIKR
jgi:hypothetical protein